jgi:hypothetical protein
LVALHLDDLGLDCPSAAQIALAKKASTLQCELERMEGLPSAGNAVDIDAYGCLVGILNRTLQILGVNRKSKTINSLGAIVASVKGGKE